jgi:hypothetical protein
MIVGVSWFTNMPTVANFETKKGKQRKLSSRIRGYVVVKVTMIQGIGRSGGFV